MDKKRKSFQHLSSKDNPQFLEDGLSLFVKMRMKYPQNSEEHLDNILNGICCSLVLLMQENVDKSDHKNFLQLIWKILNDNT